MSLRLALPLILVAGLAATQPACTGGGSAQLRVLSVQRQAPADPLVLHVRVTNKTRKPMTLQRLEYTFAGAGHRVALDQRQIQPGAAIVVEVVIDADEPAGGGVQLLEGRLFAELDQMIQSFPVTAQVSEPTAVVEPADVPAPAVVIEPPPVSEPGS